MDMDMDLFDDFEDSSEEEVEIDDDLLSPLERLQKYKTSHLLLQRLRVVKDLSDTAKQIGYEETKNHLLKALNDFSNDSEGVILQAVAEQLPFFATYLSENGNEEGLQIIVDNIIPISKILITDEHHQVRGTTVQSLFIISSHLSEDNQREHLLPIITQLSNPISDEDNRIEAAELLNKLASVFKGDILTTYVLEKMKLLSNDPMFRVRKVIATALGTISELVNEDIVTNNMLPIFLKLLSDDIWGVRKACAESIVAISKSCSSDSRINKLTPVYENLITDNSRWVRNSSFQYLGPFIATLGSDNVPPQLLKHYIGMVEGTRSQYEDSDTVRYCAFSFPGVLLTLGKDKWDILKNIYITLTQDLQWKVRRTLSHSLHEVAKILGTELTEKHLLSTFELFLKDLDQVKVGIIRHLSEFLKVLSEEKRKQYIDIITEIQVHGANWRFRKLLAKQLGQLASLYDIETITNSLIPMSIQLCEDQVTTVRYAVTRELGSFISYLNTLDNKVSSEFIDTIIPFATRSSCYDRQTYALICENLINTIDPSIFENKFFPPLLELAQNKIPNVRFIIARIFIGKLLGNEKYPSLQTQLENSKNIFKSDDDKEVRYYARPSTYKEEEEEKEELKK